MFLIPSSAQNDDRAQDQSCAEVAMPVQMPFFLVSPRVALEDGEHHVETKLFAYIEQLDELVRTSGQSLEALDAQLLSPGWLNEQSGWRLERLVGISRGQHPLKPRAQPAVRFEVASGRQYVMKNDDRTKVDRYQWIPCL
ncbi:hypothetical protein [Chitinimonas sp. JJ19]|uniref:hypothetical protein n=1 Tax=Chitinimonas sp. JJ19 TaxID=3109352 RepID=UPI003001BE24